MLQKLFSRSKVNPAEPHPLKVNFAHHTIPTLLEDNRAAFLSVLITAEGNDYLRKTWNEVGKKALAKNDIIDPKDMEVSVFKKDGFFYTFFHFPPPEQDGEPHFGLAVFHPPEEGDWNAESVESASYDYFTAVASGSTVEVWKLQDGFMEAQNAELELNKHRFVEWVQQEVAPD